MTVVWDRVTRDYVVRAIQEYDRLGPQGFFSAHGKDELLWLTLHTAWRTWMV